MNNPFKVGDKAYHARWGEGVVSSVDKTDVPVCFRHKKGTQWVSIEMLSFKPWPAPCHERPFEAVLKQGELVMVSNLSGSSKSLHRIVTEHKDSVESLTALMLKSHHTFHRVGEEIKFN